MFKKIVEKLKSFGNGNKFITGALILAGAGILSRVLGVIFRIPLANIVGSFGMGLYQMVFPLYALLLIISSAGVPVAISKMVAKELSKDKNTKPGLGAKPLQYNSATTPIEGSSIGGEEKKISEGESIQASQRECRKILYNSIVLLGVIGFVFAGLFMIFSHTISSVQGNPDLSIIYLAIAPSVFIVCIIAGFRGYFTYDNLIIQEGFIKLSLGIVGTIRVGNKIHKNMEVF